MIIEPVHGLVDQFVYRRGVLGEFGECYLKFCGLCGVGEIEVGMRSSPLLVVVERFAACVNAAERCDAGAVEIELGRQVTKQVFRCCREPIQRSPRRAHEHQLQRRAKASIGAKAITDCDYVVGQ